MAQGKLHFSAVTPDRTVLEQELDFVILRTRNGDMGILPGHESCCVELAEGIAKLYEEKEKQTDALAILGGFVLVEGNRVTVISPIAERPDRLEALLQQLEEQRREKARQEKRSDLEIHRAETALRRMLVQNDVSAYGVVHHLGEDGAGEDQDE